MKVVVVGGGPGGLYAALLLKQRHPHAHITVVERNRADDTFGWGVVLSDQTVENLCLADPVSGGRIRDALHRWDDIDIHIRDQTIRSTGHGFSGIGRKALLLSLQQRARELDAALHFEHDVANLDDLIRTFDADLIIAADGINSRIRDRFATTYLPDIDQRLCRFVWLGTPRLFEAFTFAFVETDAGWVQAHAYRFDDQLSTFIVEMPEETWRAHGLDSADTEDAISWCERTFAAQLLGAPLYSNATHARGAAQWIRFPRVECKEWVHWTAADANDVADVPVVLLGDAAHSAHFSIGSGTKLALEDAIALDQALANISWHDVGALRSALQLWQDDRSLEVLKLQNAARNSTEWFEHVARYATLPPEQFAYSMLTRSQRISHENLRVRDAQYIAQYEQWFANRALADANAGASSAPASPTSSPPSRQTSSTGFTTPMFTPLTVRGVTLANRVVVSPMAQYSALDNGMPTDWHLVHLGARATGGAALVMTEMTCVAADARITPACPGLWTHAHRDAWTRIVRFVHGNSTAKIGLQLGHAGAKGATKKMWEGIDQPLPTNAWPLIAASATQYLRNVSSEARAMTRLDMDRVVVEFTRATELGSAAGFDWLELHAAHGYLLSGFLSPLTNVRDDEYGGPLENRLRFPLEVFRAMRLVWPAARPMSVRVSAHDWAEGGNTADDAVGIARAFRDAGADMMDVSAGQVVHDETPVYGRMWQTPFADRIRQEAQIATIAVGAISDADQINGILASGRADLVAIGRPHLANPAFTLLEAARLGYGGAEWPVQYVPGKSQLERLVARERATMQTAAAKPGELT